MLCTVVTDASWCPHTGAGGWAVWIVSDKGRHKQHGQFKKRLKSSADAEFYAACNGLQIASRLFKASRYHVVTDCRDVIHRLTNKQEWLDVARSVLQCSAEITVAHVKGHTQRADARSYVNRWCDTNAKKAMQRARNGKR